MSCAARPARGSVPKIMSEPTFATVTAIPAVNGRRKASGKAVDRHNRPTTMANCTPPALPH